MPDLCQDSDDDEDDILNYYVRGADKITGRDGYPGGQEVDEGLRKEGIGTNAEEEAMGSCDRNETRL